MFNVTVLNLKDIKKHSIGIILTLIVIMFVSKWLPQDTKEEKVVQKVKNGVELLSGNSMLECLEQTVPTMATVNEEYKKIANEDDIIEEEN